MDGDDTASSPPGGTSDPTVVAGRRGRDLSYLAAVALGVVGGVLLGMSLFPKDPMRLVVVLAVPLLCVGAWGVFKHWREPRATAGNEQVATARRRSRLALARGALIIGPIVAALIAAALVPSQHPSDVLPVVLAVTSLGVIAGLIVASAIAASALFE